MTDETTSQSYVASGFNQRLGFGEKTAVVIIDMCAAYFTEGSPLNLGSNAAVKGCEQLVASARNNDVPVIWTRVEFKPGDAEGNVFYRKVGALSSFDSGNPLGDWLAELTPEPGDHVITKLGASAFFGTDLNDTLRDLGVDTLVIGGVSTSGCIRASAIDCCQSNYVPVVVPEACGDRTVEIHDANLFDVDAKYGDVVPLAEVLAHFES